MAIEGIIFLIAVLVMSVVVHEVAHGYVAYALGDPTARLAGRLTLNPLKHLDPIGSVLVPGILAALGGVIFGWAKPVPYNPYNLRAGRFGPAYVALAGPAANLAIALVFGVALRFGVLLPAVAPFFSLVVFLNIVLAVFNLLPIPPLDGSKVLFSFLPLRLQSWEDFFYRYQWIFLLFLIFVVLETGWLAALVSWIFRLITGLAA